MSGGRLALPDWRMGQVLLPEQFVAVQEALLAHDSIGAGLSGLPTYGLARLAMDEGLLAAGAVHVERLTYVFASGLIIDVPGNTVINNFNLDGVTEAVAPIYLHIRREVTDAAELREYREDPRSVTRVIFRAELSLAARHDDARESVKLIGLVRRDDGWSLEPYTPPLLRVGADVLPLLRDTLEGIVRAVHAVEGQLNRRIRDSFLGTEQGAELRRVRSAAHRALAVLADHGLGAGEVQQKVSLHPYLVFTALREFYMEAAILEDDQSDALQLRYRHNDLTGCYEELRLRIESCLSSSSLSTKRLSFERRASWYVAGPFPDELCRSREVYLILKSSGGKPVEFADVKSASPRRIEEVYTRALAGVSLTSFRSSSFAYVYGQGASFYRVNVEGDAEWAHVVRDRELCFPAWQVFEGIQAVLVWG